MYTNGLWKCTWTKWEISINAHCSSNILQCLGGMILIWKVKVPSPDFALSLPFFDFLRSWQPYLSKRLLGCCVYCLNSLSLVTFFCKPIFQCHCSFTNFHIALKRWITQSLTYLHRYYTTPSDCSFLVTWWKLQMPWNYKNIVSWHSIPASHKNFCVRQ